MLVPSVLVLAADTAFLCVLSALYVFMMAEGIRPFLGVYTWDLGQPQVPQCSAPLFGLGKFSAQIPERIALL